MLREATGYSDELGVEGKPLPFGVKNKYWWHNKQHALDAGKREKYFASRQPKVHNKRRPRLSNNFYKNY